MPDSKQLPHLLNLLDDESETVQKAVSEALAAFGPSLREELARLSEPPDEAQMQRIRDLLKGRRSGGTSSREPVDARPRFEPGQLVRHRRYNYRGVVVGFDPTCRADHAWYLSNPTQPDRNQPWYHVLADGTDQVFYAAQTSLVQDDSGEEISHPLVSRFFTEFVDGRYVRNNRPWPGGSDGLESA